MIGDPSDTLDLTIMLTSLSEKAADCQDETPENCELIDADEGRHICCTSLGEQVAGMSEAIDQTAPLPTNTTIRIDKIETEIKNFGSPPTNTDKLCECLVITMKDNEL